MENKLIMVLITLTLGIIVTGSVLMPVINDAETTDKTFTNDGYFMMDEYGTDTDVTFKWEYDNPTYITINDVAVPLNQTSAYYSPRVSLMFGGDSFLVRSYSASEDGDLNGVQFYASSGGGRSCYVGMETPSDMTIVCSGGTATVTATGSTIDVQYTSLYVPSNDGMYVMKDMNEDSYVLGDSEIHAFGYTRLRSSTGQENNPGTGITFDGSIDGGLDVKTWRFVISSATVDFSNVTINATKVNGFENLYKLHNVTMTATVTDNNSSTDNDVTYSYFLVPYEVTSEKTAHLDINEIAIIGVIPVMIIVALAVIGIRSMIGFRD